MRIRLTLLLTAALTLALASPAFADKGEGLAGETNDKVITFFCLGVLALFVLIVVIGSAIQGALDKRKDAKKAARMRQRVGW